MTDLDARAGRVRAIVDANFDGVIGRPRRYRTGPC
jgi:hypothetical protein